MYRALSKKKSYKLYGIIMLIALISVFIIFVSNIRAATTEISYNVQNDWGSGATVSVGIKNVSTEPIDSWTLTWTFSGDQKINALWNGTFTQSGKVVTVKNNSWNSVISPNNSISFGFNIAYTGTNSKPTDFSLNNSLVSSSPVKTSSTTITTMPITTSAAKTTTAQVSASPPKTTSTTTNITINDMPSNLKSSIEWVWANRILKEKSTDRQNLIFDQIYDSPGSLNYVVRWQSSKNVTLAQRQNIANMISRQVNNWTKYLANYDGWPYGNIPVKVVAWACINPAQILDKQANEVVYTDYISDPLYAENKNISAQLPVAPSIYSRFDHFTNPSYVYPGGEANRFDMYLWGTTNFGGGAGGDWGQRMSDDYILSVANANEATIIEHEIGHGFGLTDFYGADERPPGGFPVPTIMWAGNSSVITEWDAWMLRYTWTQLKKNTTRFPPR